MAGFEVASAKLTLWLKVGKKREDGLHEIEAEMTTVSLSDVLYFFESGEVEITGPEAQALVGGDEIVKRTLSACGAAAGVVIEKHIPVGGGLGGGSADAAAVLRYLGKKDPLLAVSIGSDVPFCLVGGRALVKGKGEVVEPLSFKKLEFTLFLPPFSISTARVYQVFDEVGRGPFERNHLAYAAGKVEGRLAQLTEALSAELKEEVVLAGSGSTLFVEKGTAALGLDQAGSLKICGMEVRYLSVVATPPY